MRNKINVHVFDLEISNHLGTNSLLFAEWCHCV